MPSRRSVLAFLGLAPVAAPAAIAALAMPADAIVGADVTEAGITIGPAPVVTPEMCKAWLLRAYNEMTAAELEATSAAIPEARSGHVLLETTCRGLRAPAFSGGA